MSELFEVKPIKDHEEDYYNPDITLDSERDFALSEFSKNEERTKSINPSSVDDVNDVTLSVLFGNNWNGSYSDVTPLVTKAVQEIATQATLYNSFSEYFEDQKHAMKNEALMNSGIYQIYRNAETAKFHYNLLKEMIPNFKDINAWNGSGGIIQNADGILANLQNSAEVISKIKDRVEGALTYMDDKNFEDMLNKQSTSLSSFATSNTQQLGSLLETFPHSVANKFMNADFTQNMMAMPRQLYSKLTNIATILSSVRAPSNLKEIISTIGTLREAVAEMKDATSMIEDGVNQINSLRSHLANGNYLGVFIQAGEVCKFVEKTSQFAAKYPYNQAYETEGGHIFETDNTPGKERLHIQHCTGTDVEIAPNGDMVSKIKNDCQFIVEKDFQNHVKGDQLLLVDNTAEIESKTMKFTATEDLNISAKKTTYTTDTLSILADKTLISNNDSLTLATNSSSSMSSVGPMYITSDSQIVIDAPTIFIGTGRTQLIDMKSTSTNIKSGTVYISDGLIKMNGFITLN